MKTFVLWCASIAVAVMMMVVAIPKATTVFAAGGDLTGSAWSSNIGWIDLGNNGRAYGVKVATTGTTRAISGYAWSSNIGWVSFNSAATSGCPGGGNCQARIEWGATGGPAVLIKGWARACSVFASDCSGALKPDIGVRGGWDGFISLGDARPTDGVNYGLRLNTTTGVVAPCTSVGGCAWGSEVVGWVDFSGVRVDVTGEPTICPDGVTTVPPAIACPTTCPDGRPIPSNGRCNTNITTCPDGISTPPDCIDCPPGSNCYCNANPTDFQNCPNCPADPAVGSACWCAIPANAAQPQCQSVGGICTNIPDDKEQLLGLTNPVQLPYRKTADGRCLCVAGYILNPVTFECTKPVYTER